MKRVALTVTAEKNKGRKKMFLTEITEHTEKREKNENVVLNFREARQFKTTMLLCDFSAIVCHALRVVSLCVL